MKNPYALYLPCILFLYLNALTGQEGIKDTLFSKNYEELNTLFYEWLPKDTLVARSIADAYIAKGHSEKDSVRAAKGYYYYATAFGSEMGLQYADTIIAWTENSKEKFYPTVGYMLKGYWYYHKNDYVESIKYYLISYEYALAKRNIKHQIYLLPVIASLKNRTGDHKGALIISREHLNALEHDPDYKERYCSNPDLEDTYVSDLMSAIYNLSITYLHVRETDSAKIYIQRAIKESLKYKDTAQYYECVSTAGSIAYYRGNYKVALDSLKKALPHLNDERRIAMAHYYKGQSYGMMEQHGKAVTMFLKSDFIAGKINYRFPELRQAYEYLVDHYRNVQQLDSQLIYIDKILKLDEELLKVRTMDGEISRRYDTPHLVYQKEELINSLEQRQNRNVKYKFMILGVSLLLGAGLIYYYQRQQIYRKRYRQLLSDGNKESESELPRQIYTGAGEEPGMPQETFRQIEKGLINFEKRKHFTDPDVTLYGLSRELQTNSTYLSKVINTTRRGNFSQYLHRLRIKHIVGRLRCEKKLRTYSVNALAKEAGYKTAQSFTNAFYKQTGIYPSYFIEKLNNYKENSS